MERLACYTAIHCYLDNDQAGTMAALTIMERCQNKAINDSHKICGIQGCQ